MACEAIGEGAASGLRRNLCRWPKTPLVLGGCTYNLCFNFDAISAAEECFRARGREMDIVGEGLPELTLASVNILLPCLTRKYHPDLSAAVARKFVSLPSMRMIASAIRAAWRAALPETAPDAQSKKKSEERPKQKKPANPGQSWQRLWAIARYDLNLSTGDFYSLTPSQLDSLIGRHENATRERELLFAQLTACVVNFSMAHPKRPAKLEDFMPSEWQRQPTRPEPRRRPRQAIANELRLVIADFCKPEDAEQIRKSVAANMEAAERKKKRTKAAEIDGERR